MNRYVRCEASALTEHCVLPGLAKIALACAFGKIVLHALKLSTAERKYSSLYIPSYNVTSVECLRAVLARKFEMFVDLALVSDSDVDRA